MSPPLKVVIAGGGIAANVFLRQLQRRSDLAGTIQVRAYEQRSLEDASPPGLNVIMNHNGMECLRECDPELYQRFLDTGMSVPCRNWSARTVTGEILYDLPDVVADGTCAVPALLARWDLVHRATRCDALTEHNCKVVRVEQQPQQQQEDSTCGEEKLKVLVERKTYQQKGERGEAAAAETVVTEQEWITDVDYVVAADGRYSTIRQQLRPAVSYFGPPFVADFRIVAPVDDGLCDRLLPPDRPIWRVHHQPKPITEATADPQLVAASTGGCVRVGIMKLRPGTVGMFGNLPMLGQEKLGDSVTNAAALVRLFTPSADEGAPDELGQLVLDILRDHGDQAHWTRKQETDTCYQALDGRVLFLGDSAGAIYPSLGQGANLSLEDACVAGCLFPDSVAQIAALRHSRREFVRRMSRRHAEHVADRAVWAREVRDWSDPGSAWRHDLRRLWCGKQLVLRSVVATRENFAPFGQLIAESLDGDLFHPSTDAVLDLSEGTPRFYLMKLEGGRPLRVDRITCHQKVTQCLGALGTDEDFYLVVHEPTAEVNISGLKAFCVPPRHFVKLHKGTWHVGPLWTGADDARTFVNLELTDTNEVDHTTQHFHTLLPPPRSVPSNGVSASSGDAESLVIPVYPV